MIIELKNLPTDRAIQKINFEIIFDSSGNIGEIKSTETKAKIIPQISPSVNLATTSLVVPETVEPTALGVDTNRPPKIDEDIMKMNF